MFCDFWIPKESTVTLLQSHATLSVHLWQSPKIAPEIRYTVHRCNPTPLIYNTLIWDPQMNETQIQYETKDSREIFHIRGKGSIRQLKSNMSYFDPALLVPDFSAWQSSASCNYTIAGPQICHPWVVWAPAVWNPLSRDYSIDCRGARPGS